MSDGLHPGSVLSAGEMDIPIFGLGTWQTTQEETDIALNAAIDAGYRFIDSFYGYSNESAIGHSLKKIFNSGKSNREDLFIVTKLPPIGNRPEDVGMFLKRSLKALQLSYVDLYLIGYPVGYIRKGESLVPRDENGDILLDPKTDVLKTWKAMEAQVVAGLAKNIGVRSFNREQIQRILDKCSIRPANIQLELHAYCQQKELVEFCQRNGITVTAYTPLGAPGLQRFVENFEFIAVGKSFNSAVKEPVMYEIAKKYNKKPSQIILRYMIERGIGVILKSINPKRIKENFDIFDFELTEEEFNSISDLDRGEKGRICGGSVGAGLLRELEGHHEFPKPL